MGKDPTAIRYITSVEALGHYLAQNTLLRLAFIELSQIEFV